MPSRAQKINGDKNLVYHAFNLFIRVKHSDPRLKYCKVPRDTKRQGYVKHQLYNIKVIQRKKFNFSTEWSADVIS